MATRRSKVALSLSSEEYARACEIARFTLQVRDPGLMGLNAVCGMLFLKGLLAAEQERQLALFDDSR